MYVCMCVCMYVNAVVHAVAVGAAVPTGGQHEGEVGGGGARDHVCAC